MLKKLYNQEKNMLLNKMSFYNFGSFNCIFGEEIIIELKKILGKARYCDVVYYRFNKSIRKEYNVREKALLNVLSSLFHYFKENIVIVKYDEQWLNNKKVSKKLNKLLFQDGIGQEIAAIQTEDIDFAKLIGKSILKGNTFAFFVLLEAKLIITPTDHMDIFIASPENIKALIRRILKESVKNNNYFRLKDVL